VAGWTACWQADGAVPHCVGVHAALVDCHTTTRRLRNNREVLISDTVGFIQKLPTELVAAFRSVKPAKQHIVESKSPLCTIHDCVSFRLNVQQSMNDRIRFYWLVI
jgi:hypothetical protein